MRMHRFISLVTITLLALASIQAADMETILEQAKQNSSTIQLIMLGKQGNDLSIAMSEVDQTMGLEASADLSYADGTRSPLARDSMSVNPSVTISLPNDGNTSITIGTDYVDWALDGSNAWRAKPSVSVSHTFRFGDAGDVLKDLQLTRQKLEIEQTYRQRLYDFESSILAKIHEIVGHEMTLLTNEKDILVQRTKIDNAVKLKTTTVGSATYRSMELELARLENAKASTTQKLAMARTQYAQLTGLDWEGLDTVREADLSFTYLPTGDTSVILSALDLEIAKEQLALKKRSTVKVGTSSTVPNLTVSGGTALSYAKNPLETISYDVNAGARYASGSFTTAASVSLSISDTGAVRPLLTVGGSWKNNPTVESEVLTLRSLENAVTIAGIDYQEAMLSYQIKANQLEADILSHKLDVQRFEEVSSYRQQVLDLALSALEKGLTTQSEVDQARLDVELSSHEITRYALQALILENRAKALQL